MARLQLQLTITRQYKELELRTMFRAEPQHSPQKNPKQCTSLMFVRMESIGVIKQAAPSADMNKNSSTRMDNATDHAALAIGLLV